MFNVMVSFGTGHQWQFLFTKNARAHDVLNDYDTAHMDNGVLHVEDEFGNKAALVAKNINGILIEDYSRSTEAAIERHLIQMRTQAKAQSKTNSDPALRMLAPNGMMPPMGMQRMS
jgi:hypothetical protein